MICSYLPCEKPTKSLRCSACKDVQYCSKGCQNADWARHKEPCKKAVNQAKEAIRAQERLARQTLAIKRTSRKAALDLVQQGVALRNYNAVLWWVKKLPDLVRKIGSEFKDKEGELTDEGHEMVDKILLFFQNAVEQKISVAGLESSMGNDSGACDLQQLQLQRTDGLEKSKKDRERALVLCAVAHGQLGKGRTKAFAGNPIDANSYLADAVGTFKTAKEIGEAWGFYEVECLVDIGLGEVAMLFSHVHVVDQFLLRSDEARTPEEAGVAQNVRNRLRQAWPKIYAFLLDVYLPCNMGPAAGAAISEAAAMEHRDMVFPDCEELTNLMTAAINEASTAEVSPLRLMCREEAVEYLREAKVVAGFCNVDADTLMVEVHFYLALALVTLGGEKNLEELQATVKAFTVIIKALCTKFSNALAELLGAPDMLHTHSTPGIPREMLLQLEIHLPTSLSWEAIRERVQPIAAEQHMSEVKYSLVTSMLRVLEGDLDGGCVSFAYMIELCMAINSKVCTLNGRTIYTDPRPFEYWIFLRNILPDLDSWAPEELAAAFHQKILGCLEVLNVEIVKNTKTSQEWTPGLRRG